MTNERVRLDVNRATIGDNGFTLVHWTLTNRGDNALDFSEYFGDVEARYFDIAFFNDEYESPWYLQWSLLSEVIVPSSGKRYPPVTDPDANCLCGEWPTGTYPDELPPGESIRSYSAYYLPPDTSQIDFRVPGFRVEDIPLE